ncbi:hypothetical protein RhiirC2_773865 [Rhizophagus irregularis]|uniref:Uncharacterized protein n=1 Tax=Rhizophagus irregularis TaxID=588596 RepID=A0A2N1NN03_9GLOM|nr:hypothetical protein RhiirC2_773865 [Rhizophagus irregularis]
MNIWKKRNEKWKIQRDLLGLSKKSFKEYHQTFRNNSLSQSSSRNRHRTIRDFNYVNPFNNFRNFKLSKDFLYILFSSSNFLHSGSFFTHLEANDIINYNSPSSTDICLFYNPLDRCSLFFGFLVLCFLLPAPSSVVLLEQSIIYNN